MSIKCKYGLILCFILTSLIIVIGMGHIINVGSSKQHIAGYSIAISFIGLFSTFGGAYLGAKISGDNARKLYEHQKYEEENKVTNKIELITNIKMLKVLSHANRVKESKLLLFVDTIDERSYNELMDSGIMNVSDLIDGYAKPIIDLLEDREIYNGAPRLYQSLLKMFNECNRMNYHVNHIDIKDKSGNVAEDYNNLSSKEREYLIDCAFKNRNTVRKDILINFIEFEFIEKVLNECADEVLKNISEENRLVDFVDFVDFKNSNMMRYTIDLK